MLYGPQAALQAANTMSFATELTEITVTGDGHDELDVISASSPTISSTETAVASPGIGSDRTLRPRTSEKSLATSNRKRRRTVSISENHGIAVSALKKLKLNDKKALTAEVNEKRLLVEAARKRWLIHHSHLFEPLLPTSSMFVESLRTELDDDTGKHVPLHQFDRQPSLVKGGVMKDYQLQGLSFLVWMYHNGMNCILGDEMGLGKTLQTLALLAYIKENTKGSQDPHLIICPLSVLSSWVSEAARWVSSLRALRFHGQASERTRLKDALREIKPDILLTTYESYVAEESWFKSRRWTYCVLDEGHRIKNTEINLSQKLQGIGALHRLILTGTPVQNNLVELWGLLHWLYPSVFTPASERVFKEAFDLARGVYSLPFLKASGELLGVIMLRRTKALVEGSVPPREELTVFVPMTEAQRFWTYRLLTRMDTMDLHQIFTEKLEDDEKNEGRKEVFNNLARQIKQGATAEGNQWKKLMNLLMQLRKVCDHPYLLKDAEPSPYINGEHVVAASSKLIAIDKLLADILPKGERVLIFSQWTGMLDLLEDFLAIRDIPYARLDGSTHRPRRTLDIKLFQQEKSPYQVFIISTKAGGLGINLTKATTVIMCDSDWNPQNDLQAIARAHRIGQTKTVKVYRLVCRGSVEDQMLDRIRRKLFLSVKVMSSDKLNSTEDPRLKATELMNILRKGSSALSRTDDAMDLARFLGASIQEILDLSRERESARDAKMKQDLEGEEVGTPDGQLLTNAEEEEHALLSGVAQVQSRLFEGQVVQRRVQDNKQIAQEWRELQKRAHVDRTVIIDGIAVIASHLGSAAPTAVASSSPKRKRAKFNWEDYCIYCRDGGELVLCGTCPRVFHPKCRGVSKAEIRSSISISCGQHNCSVCDRSTADAGGMLFRCRFCPQAFCEDCLPEGELDAIGDALPEFTLLNYGPQTTAYFIGCRDCHELFEEKPEIWKDWEKEIQEIQRKLEALHY